MVVKKKVNHCFHVPVIPKAPRSYRRRGAFKGKPDGTQNCAIELLAAVAGKLLLENDSSSASSNEKETTELSVNYESPKKEDYGGILFKDGALGQQRSKKENGFFPQIDSPKKAMNNVSNHCLLPEGALFVLQEASVVSNSDYSENVVTNLKSGIFERIDASSKLARREENTPHTFWKAYKGTTESGYVNHIEFEEDKTGNFKNQLASYVKTASLANSVRSPSSKGCIPETLSLKQHMIGSLGRDDDENIFRCVQSSTKVKAYRSIPRRRVKKFLSYKYKKLSSTRKDYNFPIAVRGNWPVCQSRKTYCGRERFQSDIPAKKMKSFDHGSVLTSDRGVKDENFRNMPNKSTTANMSCSAHMGCDAYGASSSPKGHKSSFRSKDSHVSLSIKSFRVPEMYIEVPENATVGSLKRSVLEAVTAMIGGGVHVGVRLRGKKVRDDSRTLLQTGISSKGNVGTLGFELEPSFVEVPSSRCVDDSLVVLSGDSILQSARSPISPATPSAGFVASDPIHDTSPLAIVSNHSQSNHYVVLTPAPSKSLSDGQLKCKAIVPYSEMNAVALTAVPIDQKARRSELAQRRIRRPFSVAEVEALVQSVEKTGTGRWRDVKLCAFDNANHRTYVDLKDKWKTLVHTAQIAPHQRRGQPVPQELLDRVLAAHAYWSQHQAKQLGKHQHEVPTEVM